ncbi:MAG: hypothetical protein ACXV76_09305, partial [Halobacteriota archaeon]
MVKACALQQCNLYIFVCFLKQIFVRPAPRTMRNSKPLWLPEFQSFRGFATLEVIVFHSVVAGVAALALVSPPASGILALIAGSSFGGV